LHFQIHNSYTQVFEATEEENELLAGWSTKEYHYYGIDYTQRPSRRAKKTAFLNYYQNGKFPTGWAGDFIRRLEDQGMEVEVEDARSLPGPLAPLDHNIPKLRDYQTEAFKIAIERSRGIVYHATGAGKTLVMAQILATLGRPAIIIVPTLNLLMQTHDCFKEYFGEAVVGRIGEGMFIPRLLTVSTVQSLWSHIKAGLQELTPIMQACEVLMIDEGHHINIAGKNKIQNTYFQIVQLVDAYYKFGFTATPGEEGELERILLEGATGRVIHKVTSSDLIKRGLLTQPHIKIYKVTCPGRFGDWPTAYRRNILGNRQRNRMIQRLALYYSKLGRSVLVIVNRVEDHGVILCEAIEDSVLMIGQTPTSERKEILEDFRAKRLKILISTVVNEGVDVPSMDVVIMAGGGKSNRMVIQRVGRALRTSEGKEEAVIIDFYDQDNGMMLKHSRARVRTYKSEEAFNVEPYIDEEASRQFWATQNSLP